MREDCRGVGEDESIEHREIGDGAHGGDERIEAASDKHEVQRSDGDLRKREAEGGHLDRPAEEGEAPAQKGSKNKIARRHQSQPRAKNDSGTLGQMQELSGEIRLRQKRHNAEHTHSEQDGRPAEYNDLCDFLCTESDARIEAIADRAAAQRREANVVTEGKSNERGEGGGAVGERVPCVEQRKPIVHAQAEVARRRKTKRHQEPFGRDSSDRLDHFGIVIGAERAPEQHDREERHRSDCGARQPHLWAAAPIGGEDANHGQAFSPAFLREPWRSERSRAVMR